MDNRFPFLSSLAGMIGDEPNASPALPVKEAQADHLRQLVDTSLQRRANLNRGDAVHYLGGIGPMKKVFREGLVFRFWRYLDYGNPADQRRIDNMGTADAATFPDVDCLLVYFDGNCTIFILGCSSFLLAGDA